MPRKLHKCQQCENLTNGRLCKPCDSLRRKSTVDPATYHRFWQTKRKYNIDEMDFEALWIAQLGKCGICGNQLRPPLPQRGQPLDVVAIDHDHKTGKVRGLACDGCNRALGLVEDSPERLRALANYLEASR